MREGRCDPVSILNLIYGVEDHVQVDFRGKIGEREGMVARMFIRILVIQVPILGNRAESTP